MAKKSKEAPHLRVRLPAALLARLEKSIKDKGGGTLTGEIVERLEESFRKEDVAALIAKQQKFLNERREALDEERKTLDEERKSLNSQLGDLRRDVLQLRHEISGYLGKKEEDGQ